MTQEPTRQTPRPGQPERVVAGRYVLLRELGRGGMGVVWLGEDRMIGRQVAVKELRLPDGVPPDERRVLEERVLREARAAGRLNDPAVVTVHDVAQEAGTTYIVMELIEAPTLSDIVSRQGPQSPDTVTRLAGQLLSALEAAHAAGIVHRDVKPSNIMVSANGRVKLTDFGIARSTDDPKLTTSGVLIGSPGFMPPERLRGANADASSDLWGLGAVLFFAVEGHSPFERSSTAATMHAILNDVPYLTRSQGPLASVIMGLLNTVPEARLSAEQVRGLLAQATYTPPGGFTGQVTQVHAPPAGATMAIGATGRAPRRGLLVGMAAGLAVVMFAAGFLTDRALGGGVDRPAAMDDTVTFGEDGTLPEFTWDTSSTPGRCLNGRIAPGRRISGNVECGEPHDLEVYADDWTMSIPDEDDTFSDVRYPDVEDLHTYAERFCTMVFESAYVVGDEVAKEELRYRAVVPSEKGWLEYRGVYCVLRDAEDDQLTRSYVASK